MIFSNDVDDDSNSDDEDDISGVNIAADSNNVTRCDSTAVGVQRSIVDY